MPGSPNKKNPHKLFCGDFLLCLLKKQVMKKTILIAVSSILMFACSPGISADEQRINCLDLLDKPSVKEYYMKAYLEGWHANVESCGNDVACLTKCYDMLLDKAAEAEAEIMLKKAGVE